MKFAVAVVMLALAIVGAQSSLLYPSLAYSTAAIHPGGPYLAQGPALYPGIYPGAYHGAYPAAVAAYPAPALPAAISLTQGPYHGALSYAHAAPAPLALAHQGTYVAKTRGAIHTAPLAGHINSATSINLAPAPGTI